MLAVPMAVVRIENKISNRQMLDRQRFRGIAMHCLLH